MAELEPEPAVRRTNEQLKIPSSLDLAFEWEKGVLSDQKRADGVLETKATTLFSSATAVLGLGVAVGVLKFDSLGLLSILTGGLALAAYGFVIGFTFGAIRLRNYETLDNPIKIREQFWSLSPAQFKMELLTHMECSYTKNETNLLSKSRATRNLIIATAAEVVFLVISLVLSL